MNLVYIVMGLALVQYLYFGFAVGSARGRYGVPAPASSGHEMFDRYNRVHLNTLELLVVLVPALPLFAYYISPTWAAALGAVYLVGRFVYFFSYIKDPKTRGAGYGLSFLPVALLLLGGLGGAIALQFRG
ncbi:MAG: MAPEG family protein [Pseudomonadota bacterium]